jgi:hypothetical protein
MGVDVAALEEEGRGVEVALLEEGRGVRPALLEPAWRGVGSPDPEGRGVGAPEPEGRGAEGARLERRAQGLAVDGVEDREVDGERDDGHGREQEGEARVRDARHGPDQHVLRVAGDRRDAADVGSGRERDEVGLRIAAEAPRHREHERG